MPTNAITVTGASGPALTTTTQTFQDVIDLDFDIRAQVLRVRTNTRNYEFDLFTIATVTYSITAHSAIITVST